MEDQRAEVRIHCKNGTDYNVTEPFGVIEDLLHTPGQWLDVTCIHAQRLFGTERARIRRDEILSIQEWSAAGWSWTCQMNELHYARQMAEMEHSPQQQIAEAQRAMVALAKKELGEDDD
jgi:hypothetical protein